MLAKLTTSAKVSLAMKTVGLNSEETKAIDGLISKFGAHPVVVLATGNEYTSLKQLVALGIDAAQSDQMITNPMVSRVGALLSDLKMTDALSEMVVGYIEDSKYKDDLLSALEKVRSLPIPGFGDQEYNGPRDFVSRGLLGYVSHAIEQKTHHEQPFGTEEFVSCPHCDGMFLTGLQE